jgi:hypothetical protein
MQLPNANIQKKVTVFRIILSFSLNLELAWISEVKILSNLVSGCESGESNLKYIKKMFFFSFGGKH